ncbi:MAG TPA: BON domain-containing protein [Bryobacteraceae bacterium]|nr:BON domain-containing protein [Bryobacteraceae bacterium]
MNSEKSKSTNAGERSLSGLSLIAGAVLGATLMYFCDPHRGKTRRAELQQKGAGAARQAAHELAKRAEDLLNRAKGLVAEVEAAMECGEQTVDDSLIADRVRSHLGHVTEHASAIETAVVNGIVVLRGTISSDKKRAVVDEVLSVPGVKGIRDLLVAA